MDEPAFTCRSVGAARIRNLGNQGSLDVPKLTGEDSLGSLKHMPEICHG